MTYTLITNHLSTDTVEALEKITNAAKSGEVVGIAYALFLRRRRFIVDCAGAPCENPVLARGIVAVLDDQFAEMIRSKTDSSSTM